MGGKDNYKIREAKREFVYVVLRMMIAKAGFEGILRNQTLGGEVCSTQAYELSKANSRASKILSWARKPRDSEKESRRNYVATSRETCYNHSPGMLFTSGSTHRPKGRFLYIG